MRSAPAPDVRPSRGACPAPRDGGCGSGRRRVRSSLPRCAERGCASRSHRGRPSRAGPLRVGRRGGRRCRPANRRPPPGVFAGRSRLAWGRVGAPTQVVSSLLQRIMHGFLSFPQAGATAGAASLPCGHWRGIGAGVASGTSGCRHDILRVIIRCLSVARPSVKIERKHYAPLGRFGDQVVFTAIQGSPG